MIGGQALADRGEGRLRAPVVDADAGHDRDALRFDEDLALLVLRGADDVPVEVVGAAEPGPVPAVRVDGGHHVIVGLPRSAARRHRRDAARRSARISCTASVKSAAMKTDSATPPPLFSVVWKASPGVSLKQLRLRQSFQSARPMSGSPWGPRRSSVYSIARTRCWYSGASEPGLVVERNRLIEDGRCRRSLAGRRPRRARARPGRR